MVYFHHIVLGLMVVGVTSAGWADEPAKPRPKEPVDANHSAASAVVGRVAALTYEFNDETDLEYAVFLPKGYRKDGQKYPLIVALHGLYSNPRQILGYPGFTQAAEELGYILVAPMGYNNHGWYGSRGTGGGGRRDPKNLGELSEKDVMNVLELAKKHYPVDDQRIYLYGHSMGGGGALHLAMKYPDVWAAIAIIAPAANSRGLAKLSQMKKIPAIVVQGDRDRLVSVRGTRRLIEKFKEVGVEHRYIEVAGGGHVTVAWAHMDDIFEFIGTRSKAVQEGPLTASDDVQR